MTTAHPPSLEHIREHFRQARQSSKARHRDIAAQLHISEGQLIAAYVGSDALELQAQRLRPEWAQIIAQLETLGTVLALTRNESCVHEKIGVYQNTSANAHVGLVLGSTIDLRIFYRQWAHGFAVQDQSGQGDQAQLSLQFFDAAGTAVHKIILKPQSDIAAYEQLCAQFAAADQSTGISPAPAQADQAERQTEQLDSAVDAAALRQAWGQLRDPHDFFPMLKKHDVTRLQALRLVGADFAQAVDVDAARVLLEAAALQQVAIMVFTDNLGVVQIHTGVVHQVAIMGPWLNVLDPDFNLHLRQDHIASAWLVRKPTVDGLVSSLELFDAAGQTIALFFGARKPGQPELGTWRGLLADLADLTQGASA